MAGLALITQAHEVTAFYTDNILAMWPDSLLSEVTQSSNSQLSEIMVSRRLN